MFSTPVREQEVNSSLNRSLTPVRVMDIPETNDTGLTESNLSDCKERLYLILRTLCDNHKKWHSYHSLGVKLCTNIEVSKANAIKTINKEVGDGDECSNSNKPGDLYSRKIERYCHDLQYIFREMYNICKSAHLAWKQVTAMSQLIGHSDHVLFRTWSMVDVLNILQIIVERYVSELQAKHHITGHIAHCWCLHDLIRCSTTWEISQHVNDYVELLFAFIEEEIVKGPSK